MTQHKSRLDTTPAAKAATPAQEKAANAADLRASDAADDRAEIILTDKDLENPKPTTEDSAGGAGVSDASQETSAATVSDDEPAEVVDDAGGDTSGGEFQFQSTECEHIFLSAAEGDEFPNLYDCDGCGTQFFVTPRIIPEPAAPTLDADAAARAERGDIGDVGDHGDHGDLGTNTPPAKVD